MIYRKVYKDCDTADLLKTSLPNQTLDREGKKKGIDLFRIEVDF